MRRRLVLLLALICACGLLDGCLKKKLRRFGATCGVDSECEGGVCYQGRCTASCQSAAECESGICLDKVCQPTDDDFDGDSLSNAYEQSHKFDPAKVDTDDDGIADPDEIGVDPAHPLDSNQDGLPDAAQSNTKDVDGDCVVDAWDDPTIEPSPLPAAACQFGVCLAHPELVQVVCNPVLLNPALGPQGCLGCTCKATGIATFQEVETKCDSLDNDCNGEVDQGLTFAGLPVGATCTAAAGICSLQVGAGIVECAADGTTVCSTGPGGSQQLGQTEVCNAQDDDCDGTTDDGYSWQGKTVGTACEQCGYQPAKCPNGNPINPPVVGCTDDGATAVCSGVPFAAGFIEASAGAPQPRAQWTAAYVSSWNRVVMYGGRVPGATGGVDRDEAWTLDVVGETAQVTQPSLWQRQRNVTGKPRSGGALAWDEASDRLLLLGGTSEGAGQTAVWSLGPAGEATEVSALPKPSPLYVPDVPMQSPIPQASLAHAVVLPASGGNRTIVLVQPGQGVPNFAALGGQGAWQPVQGSLGDEVACLIAAGNVALAITPDGKLFRVSATTTAASSAAISSNPAAPDTVEDAQCVLDAAGKLHLFGIAPDSTTVHRIGTLSAAPDVATSIAWLDATDSQAVTAVLRRNGGFVGLDATGTAFVLGGGADLGTDGHRKGRADVQSWQPLAGTVKRIDTEVPAARVGEASGWSTKNKAFCIAGGLLYDLPDGKDGAARVLPATDAWCGTPSGVWQKIAENIPAFALGISGVDAKSNRLIMAAGLPLAGPVLNLPRLWQGQLLSSGKIDPDWTPVATVRSLDLATGTVSSAVSADAPTLAASSVVTDPLRNRVLVYGGFDNIRETTAFYSLDLATLQWTDLGAKLTSAAHPNPRMGALMIYDARRDVLAITAGSLRTVDGDSLGVDAPFGAQGLGACSVYQGIVETDHVLVWVGLGSATPFPQFNIAPVPSFLDLSTVPPKGPLLRQFPAGPAFLPVLFDALGGHAWLAVQERPGTQPDQVNQCPAAPAFVSWTEATVQVSLDLGTCGGLPAIVANPNALLNPPTALLLATSVYVESQRLSLIWSGVDQDGGLSGSLSRLDQQCGP